MSSLRLSGVRDGALLTLLLFRKLAVHSSDKESVQQLHPNAKYYVHLCCSRPDLVYRNVVNSRFFISGTCITFLHDCFIHQGPLLSTGLHLAIKLITLQQLEGDQHHITVETFLILK